jgi:hypothetical protein
MNVQAPTLTTRPHRTPLMLAAAALTSAAVAVGVIAVVDGGSDSTAPAVAPVKPALVQVSKDRVWDGSAILRGTEPTLSVAPAKVAPPVERVWDGSPILRGTALQHNTIRHSGGPSTTPLSEFKPPTFPGRNPTFPGRSPEGFHGQP